MSLVKTHSRKVFSATFLSASILAMPALSADKDPLHIVVSLADQQLKVYRGLEKIAQSNISSGKEGHATPTGIFTILHKNRKHFSNIYDNAPMPFMQRLTWSGIALHASNSVPNYPASHGCIRMPHDFAKKLFGMKTNGMHVIIEKEPQAPELLRHTNLFKPTKTWKVSKKYDTWVNKHIDDNNFGLIVSDPNRPVRILITRRTEKEDLLEVQRLLQDLNYDIEKVDGLMGPNTWKAIVKFQKVNGLKETGKIDTAMLTALYERADERMPANARILVRQNQKPLYEGAANILNPELPLGSHLISTTGFDEKTYETGWMVMSLQDRVQRRLNLASGKQVIQSTARHPVLRTLDRIKLNDITRDVISRLLTPGSSFAISDNGISIETNDKGTDFIVLTKPKPLNLASN